MTLVVIISILLLYFIPTAVANERRHKNKTAILLTNIFFGWTLVGWIVALIWASTSNVTQSQE